MYFAIATENGWNLYRKGAEKPLSYFDKLTTISNLVEQLGGKLTVIINGYTM
jgi:hypothetical protein